MPANFGATAPLWRVELLAAGAAVPLALRAAAPRAPRGLALCTIALHPGSHAIVTRRFPHAFALWLHYHLRVLGPAPGRRPRAGLLERNTRGAGCGSRQ